MLRSTSYHVIYLGHLPAVDDTYRQTIEHWLDVLLVLSDAATVAGDTALALLTLRAWNLCRDRLDVAEVGR